MKTVFSCDNTIKFNTTLRLLAKHGYYEGVGTFVANRQKQTININSRYAHKKIVADFLVSDGWTVSKRS
jgi:hypothetical protein